MICSARTVIMSGMLLAALPGCDGGAEKFTFFSLLPPSTRDIRAPANLPPEGYSSEFWVDRRGCEYLRAGNGSWIPRFGNDGRAMCSADFRGITGSERRPQREVRPEPGEVVSVNSATGAVTRIADPVEIPPSYVNVATFRQTQNGLAARKIFAEMGFPIVGANRTPRPGQTIRVVLGPFMEQDALDDALRTAQSMGYRSAAAFRN